jgi:hypothetical protein
MMEALLLTCVMAIGGAPVAGAVSPCLLDQVAQTAAQPATQTSTPAPAAPAEQAAPEEDDPDEDVNLAQPDFTLAALPTSLRLPRHGSAFRVTHRFGRPLGQGSFGNLVEDFFGFDAGGLIGLEYRFGLRRGTQAVVHRTSDRTIQFSALHELIGQAPSRPFGLTLLASVEGLDNFRDEYSPGVGLIISREIAERGAVYLEPLWIGNAARDFDGNEEDAALLAVGARIRVSRAVYVVAEAAPRLRRAGDGTTHVAFGLERRAGGHAFQLNFSNGLGTTFGQVARGGPRRDDWYIGFNISRKFF